MNARFVFAYRSARRYVTWREEYVRLALRRGVHPNVIADTILRQQRRIGRRAMLIARELELRDLERRGIRVRP